MKKKKVNVWDFLEPIEDTLIVTEPKAVARAGGGLRTSDTGRVVLLEEKEALRATFGCVCKVLRVHEGLKKKYPVRSGLLIHEHGGTPVYSDTSQTSAWIITVGDILAKVDKAYWDHYDA